MINSEQTMIDDNNLLSTTPQFKIIWLDENFMHLQSSIHKIKCVLFNASVDQRDFNESFDLIELEKHVRNLISNNNHVMVITSYSKGKGCQVLELLQRLKRSNEEQVIYSCVYSGSALRNVMLQNLCILQYGADFVSSLNNANALLELESFIAQIYQKSYYPKLMKYLSRLVFQKDNMEHLISPTSTLVRSHMVLEEEIERETLREQGKEYDCKWEHVPLRKIAHNLHLQQSACLSLTHRPLVQQPQFLVMIQTGAINPPHKMHQQGFEVAKEFVENYQTLMKAVESKPKLNRELLQKILRPIKVVGCYMSPSHDGYIKSKASKYKYSSTVRLYTATERLTMCALQTQDDPFTCEYPWESCQPKFISFSQVGNTCSTILRSAECPISMLMPKNPNTNQYQDSCSYLRVCYTCGADLILRAGLRRFDYFEDMLSLVVGRHGVNVEEVMKSINEAHNNMPVFYVEIENMQENALSSTEVRTCLENIAKNEDVKNSRMRLEKVLDLRVLEYIINDCKL
ncbi:nicotinamide-nucleotide adenylyltransferase [Naegleria gruberi]|uniref:Nicotinamide-nucleotide adenylyltransferase n=1 Tax=Naegleria gruberi TaxID=5762 RepID=D2VTL7_NAEGR|nr:nicotinamide-nucleotide adenylyltransferase [Naegleria gruberi]EFC39883.1 nicotinamide-nucleotide adenylyltransferase [Naegleria gruberi]|eukprot:XP_002672627.1 nicotinamide-nucleotide adenylyltransferase [Naegleria gruberi strain NEG-M]